MSDSILSSACTPDDLKLLPASKLPELADEIRTFLVDHVSRTGGHLASNLGVVELTIALLRVLNPPIDHVLFDVGHQAYVYKILTGRSDRFDSLRTPSGLSGFIKRSESEYDAFGAGHSSTSLSAALGFARAERLRGSEAYTVAVIGDGAYTGGMIHEALNNCEKDLRLIIVLNENEMSISKNIGSFAQYLSGVRQTQRYRKAKRNTKTFLSHIPLVGNRMLSSVTKIKKRWKNRLYGSNYFEDLGLYYIGPTDGNDEAAVESALRLAMDQHESVLIHLKTKKGKGYLPAEENPGAFHCIPPVQTPVPEVTMSAKFGELLCALAQNDPAVCAVTAAMTDGTGLAPFKQSFPDRFFDVGIAEEHALTFSAGLAANGLKPFFAVYSSFLQRGYDNLIHDIALQKLPVTICIDRIGLNATDGATHHGIFDVSFLSSIPCMELLSPVDAISLAVSLNHASTSDHSVAIRYSHGAPLDWDQYPELHRAAESFVKGEILPPTASFTNDDTIDAVIVTYGTLIKEAYSAIQMLKTDGIRCGLLLIEQIKPYSVPASQIVRFVPDTVRYLLLAEEGVENGGAAMILASELYRNPDTKFRIGIRAIRNSFVDCIPNGMSLLEAAGLDAASMANDIRFHLISQ